jgi:hypothetical protein
MNWLKANELLYMTDIESHKNMAVVPHNTNSLISIGMFKNLGK